MTERTLPTLHADAAHPSTPSSNPLNGSVGPRTQAACDAVRQATDHTADRAERAIESTRGATNQALDALHDGVEQMRDQVPGRFSQRAEQVEALARRGLERARAGSAAVQQRCVQAGESSREYIREEPIKSVLIAAAAGAVVAGLFGWMNSRRGVR